MRVMCVNLKETKLAFNIYLIIYFKHSKTKLKPNQIYHLSVDIECLKSG